MKVKQKERLEELFEEEEVEQDALAEAEVLAVRQEDISYKLDISQDLSGLIGLLEEKKDLQKKDWGDVYEYTSSYGLNGVLIGLGIGFVAGILNNYLNSLPLQTLVAYLAPVLVGSLVGYAMGKNRMKKEKQEQDEKLKYIRAQIQTVEERLNQFNLDYREGDVVFFNYKNEDCGNYFLGELVKVEGELRLCQLKGDRKNSLTHYSLDDDVNVHCVLTPGQELSSDDLQVLTEKANPQYPVPVVIKTLADSDAYAFMKKADWKESFLLCSDIKFGYPLMGFQFNEFGEEKRIARLLVPELKPVKILGNYRVNAK